MARIHVSEGYTLLRKDDTSASSLWLGEDHLLLVACSSPYFPIKETFRRFRYADIQAIVLRPTSRHRMINGLAVCLAVLFGLIVLTLESGGSEAAILGSVMVLPWIVMLAWNLAKGPSCALILQTAVQEVEVPTFRRRKVALRALETLRARVSAVQGEMPGPPPVPPAPVPADAPAQPG